MPIGQIAIYSVIIILCIISTALCIYNLIYINSISSQISLFETELEKKAQQFDFLKKERHTAAPPPSTSVFDAGPIDMESTDEQQSAGTEPDTIHIVRNVHGVFESTEDEPVPQADIQPEPGIEFSAPPKTGAFILSKEALINPSATDEIATYEVPAVIDQDEPVAFESADAVHPANTEDPESADMVVTRVEDSEPIIIHPVENTDSADESTAADSDFTAEIPALPPAEDDSLEIVIEPPVTGAADIPLPSTPAAPPIDIPEPVQRHETVQIPVIDETLPESTPEPDTGHEQFQSADADADIMDVVSDDQPPYETIQTILLYSPTSKDADFASAWKSLTTIMTTSIHPEIHIDFADVQFLYDKEISYLDKMKSIIESQEGKLKFIHCDVELVHTFQKYPQLAPLVDA